MRKPDCTSLEKAIDILKIWQGSNDVCPLHQDGDANPEECNCADQAKVNVMISWLKEIQGEAK